MLVKMSRGGCLVVPVPENCSFASLLWIVSLLCGHSNKEHSLVGCLLLCLCIDCWWKQQISTLGKMCFTLHVCICDYQFLLVGFGPLSKPNWYSPCVEKGAEGSPFCLIDIISFRPRLPSPRQNPTSVSSWFGLGPPDLSFHLHCSTNHLTRPPTHRTCGWCYAIRRKPHKTSKSWS